MLILFLVWASQRIPRVLKVEISKVKIAAIVDERFPFLEMVS